MDIYIQILEFLMNRHKILSLIFYPKRLVGAITIDGGLKLTPIVATILGNSIETPSPALQFKNNIFLRNLSR